MKNKQYKRSKWENRNFVVGIDEVGRGSLAGPVVAGAVLINSKFKIQKPKLQFKIQNLEMKDSKKLTSKKREEFYKIFKKTEWLVWGIGRVSEKMIDKINVLKATKLAMRRAVKNLEKKRGEKLPRNKTILIIDGNQGINSDYFETPIVKADEKIFLCSCASIIAKVQRDNLMKKYEKIYSQYGFAKHKGYPTKSHKKMIKKHGLSPIHRKSFKINKNKTEKERNPRANYY